MQLPSAGQQQLPNKEEVNRHKANRSVIKNVSTTACHLEIALSRLITNNKNFGEREKKDSRRALDSCIVLRMGEDRTRAEPPSTDVQKLDSMVILLRARGQSVALFPIERFPKGGGRREKLLFLNLPSPFLLPFSSVSRGRSGKARVYKNREEEKEFLLLVIRSISIIVHAVGNFSKRNNIKWWRVAHCMYVRRHCNTRGESRTIGKSLAREVATFS